MYIFLKSIEEEIQLYNDHVHIALNWSLEKLLELLQWTFYEI